MLRGKVKMVVPNVNFTETRTPRYNSGRLPGEGPLERSRFKKI